MSSQINQENTQQDAAIKDLDARMSRVEAILFPAPPPVVLEFGARVPPSSSGSPYYTQALLEAVIGKIQIGRVFYTGGAGPMLPLTFSPFAQGYDGVTDLIVSYDSPGQTIQYCESFAAMNATAQVPIKLHLCFKHEPENPSKGNTGAVFVEQFIVERAIVKSVGCDDITFGPIYECFEYLPGQNGADGSFIVPAEYCDWIGADVYQPVLQPGVSLAMYPNWTEWYKWVKEFGLPIRIAEFGIYAEPDSGSPDPAQQARRVVLTPSYRQDMIDLNVISALQWCAPGKAGEPGGYMPSDQASLDALKDWPRD
jgi:hypothetical protein